MSAPISREGFINTTSKLYEQCSQLESTIGDMEFKPGGAEELENILERSVSDLVHQINSVFCSGLSQFNVQEEWFQTCLNTLSAAKGLFSINDTGLMYRPDAPKLGLLQKCITLLLNGDENEAYIAFGYVPQREQDAVYSSMSSQLFDEPNELMVGQDHFYMSGISTITKVQALISAWKKASDEMLLQKE